MGKHAKKTTYRKLLQEEKAKTKLKISHKTILPKGQNITNTSFKVRKIVIKSQLRDHVGEIVSRSNLNVKDLLSRLHHHNAPLRSNSLSSLCEVIEVHGNIVLKDHLSALLHSASNLILDREQDVRSEAIKLLSMILTKTSEDQLTELFEIIVKHLACAMNHIDNNIRTSSLLMLDTLIDKTPKLTAKFCHPVILPAFLDLISTKFVDSDRKLLVQYSDKMTSSIWRMKVLNRLQALLKAIVNVHKEHTTVREEQEYVKRIKWSNEQPVYASLYVYPFDENKTVDVLKMQSEKGKSQIDQNNGIQNYTEILVPLLLDIFVEVAPQKTKNQRSAQLSNEAAVLLKYICDIILLLWQIFEQSDSPNFLKNWFLSKFASRVVEHLIINRFPFTMLERGADIYKNKSNKNVITGIPSEYHKLLIDKQCTNLNVTLSQIYLLMCCDSQKTKEFKFVIQYITDLLPRCLELERETATQLLNCADFLFSSEIQTNNSYIDMKNLIKVIKQLYDESLNKNDAHHIFVSQKIVAYLFKMVLVEKFSGSVRNSELCSWLDSLPKVLTEKKLTYQLVKYIAHIARCNIPIFIDSLDTYIESILDNLPNLEIICDRKSDRIEAKKLIANLLYFVKTWDDDFVQRLQKGLSTGYFSHLSGYIKDILKCRECIA